MSEASSAEQRDKTAAGSVERTVKRYLRAEEGYQRESTKPVYDQLAVEEPLEIRLEYGNPEARFSAPVSVTMRTPGHDAELALGFLHGEGIIPRMEEVLAVNHISDQRGNPDPNVIQLTLRPGFDPDVDRLKRNFYTTSSCGVCGKGSLDAVRSLNLPDLVSRDISVKPALISSLPSRLIERQSLFQSTGGIHAAGLFSSEGQVKWIREDVGRHNAVDKVIGSALLAEGLPAGDILVVSGRASFELVQKAVSGGVPILVAVGAPSSLAVDLAVEFGMTLIGFTRDSRFNVYSRPSRIKD